MDAPSWLNALNGRSFAPVDFRAAKRRIARPAPPPILPEVPIVFRQWDGPVGAWEEHFGKGRKQVYPLDGGPPERSCAEVEVAKLLRSLRAKAYWISSFVSKPIPSLWREWGIPLGERPAWLSDFDVILRRSFGAPSGGTPDVVAWNPVDPLVSALFVECKGEGESVKESQEDWVRAAIEQRGSSEQFAVALRVFR